MKRLPLLYMLFNSIGDNRMIKYVILCQLPDKAKRCRSDRGYRPITSYVSCKCNRVLLFDTYVEAENFALDSLVPDYLFIVEAIALTHFADC